MSRLSDRSDVPAGPGSPGSAGLPFVTIMTPGWGRLPGRPCRCRVDLCIGGGLEPSAHLVVPLGVMSLEAESLVGDVDSWRAGRSPAGDQWILIMPIHTIMARLVLIDMALADCAVSVPFVRGPRATSTRLLLPQRCCRLAA